jgi:nucleoside-diphosphate-sugar epimerase
MGLRDCRVTPDRRNNPGELYAMEADIAKLAALGFRTVTSFADGLNQTVAWLRENRQPA